MDARRASTWRERPSGLMAHALEGRPPAWVRKLEAMMLVRSFARAFDVEPPTLFALSADDALDAYREFTAACMELTHEGEPLARWLRDRLGEEAFELGSKVRRVFSPAHADAFSVARYLYRGIGIELVGNAPGDLRFGPCFFAGRYTPRDCWFMSAFDEGFLRGVMGLADARLAFSCRLTQGGTCCNARFGEAE